MANECNLNLNLYSKGIDCHLSKMILINSGTRLFTGKLFCQKKYDLFDKNLIFCQTIKK